MAVFSLILPWADQSLIASEFIEKTENSCVYNAWLFLGILLFYFIPEEKK